MADIERELLRRMSEFQAHLMAEIEKFKDEARQNEKGELQEPAEGGRMIEDQGENPPADSETCGRNSSEG